MKITYSYFIDNNKGEYGEEKYELNDEIISNTKGFIETINKLKTLSLQHLKNENPNAIFEIDDMEIEIDNIDLRDY